VDVRLLPNHPYHKYWLYTRLPSKENHFFAVKEIFPRQEVDPRHEVKILRRLSSDSHTHAHLISLLATYEQHGRYHIIFAWAEADLVEYWKTKKPNPSNDLKTVLWLAEQCHGLTHGLSTIHRHKTRSGSALLRSNSLPNEGLEEDAAVSQADRAPLTLFGRHGDIKPNNILWFPDWGAKGGKGILKITDFGISHFSAENPVKAKDHGIVANSPT
jgi:serine/threonine protein kinase